MTVTVGTSVLIAAKTQNRYTFKSSAGGAHRQYLTEDAHRVPEEVEAAHDLVQLPQKSADVVALERVR